MRKIWLIPLWTLLVVAQAAADSAYLEVGPETTRVDLAQFTHTWIETGQDTPWQQAFQRFHNHGFNPPSRDAPNIGYSSDTLWIAVPVATAAAIDSQFKAMLEFRYPALDSIHLWLLRNGRVSQHFVDGDQAPQPTVTEPTLSPSFPVRLDYGESNYLILARLSSEGSVQAPMTFWRESAFFRELPRKNFAWGLYYGVMLLALAFNLFLWFSTRRPIYAPYLVFVLGIMTSVALLNGHGRYLLGQSVAMHLVPFAPQFGFLAFCGLIVFTQRVLQTRLHLQRMHALLSFTLFANVIPMLGGQWLGYRLTSVLVAVDGVWLLFICLATALVSMRHQRRIAVFYLTSWAPFLGALLIFMGRNLGWLPNNLITQHALEGGLILSVVLLSLVIADSLKQAEAAAGRSAKREQEALRALADNQKETTLRALQDPVTGLPNKAQLARFFEIRFADGRGAATLVIFRAENQRELLNTLGEANVDRLTQTAAQRLESLPLASFGALPIRSDHQRTHRLAQVEGRNFMAVLQPQPSPARLGLLAQQVEDALNEPIKLPALDMVVQYRLGSVNFPQDGNNLATLIRKAQVAADQAIALRRQHAHYRAEADPYQPERLLVAYKLKQAIRRDELELFFQPQMRLLDRDIYGLEALIRWPQPGGNPMSPAEFIPIAERTGLIGALTDWVIETALQACERLNRSGVAVRVSVNLSAHDVVRTDLPMHICSRLRQLKLKSDCFAVEITESMLIDDWTPAIANLHLLRRAGIHVSLDDFGTGYSALSYLHRLPIDCLKIDQHFVRRLQQDTSGGAIIGTIVKLAESFGMSVIAEGVETEMCAKRLQALGCESIQGYWLAKPMPLEATLTWLKLRQSGKRVAKSW